ncbi:MAG TPA: DUF1015 domain-containing protein [Terriglobales bacterium]
MARIRPFSAFRYDLSRVAAAAVLTQPYDKISPDMRARYLAASPYNLVRVILGEKHDSDTTNDNVYTRAAGYLQNWIEAGVLRADPEPGIYPYTQTFRSPASGETFTRRGFIALGGLEPYDKKVVYRHEQTLSGPKADRQALLRATHTHFGQIFMLYSDPTQSVERELLERARTPVLEASDEYGTEHRLYRETDAGVLERLRHAMAPLPLVIADGHHRYETALQWSAEQTAQAAHRPDRPWEWAMMTFVNLDAPGLVVLPTHRLVYGLKPWNAATVREKLRAYFDFADTGLPAAPESWARLRPQLEAAATQGIAFAAALAGEPHVHMLRPRADLDLAKLLPDALPEQRQLDLVVLHQLGLNLAMGVTPEMVRAEQHLRYVKEAAEALQSVAVGAAQAAFLLHPIPAKRVRDVALAGGVMPQKSTDFFPKLLTGLTLQKVS